MAAQQLLVDTETIKKGGEFTIIAHIIEANIEHKLDPIVVITVFSTKQLTKRLNINQIENSNENIKWDEKLVFHLKLETNELSTGGCLIEIFDGKIDNYSCFLGGYEFDLSWIYYKNNHQIYQQWITLTNDNKNDEYQKQYISDHEDKEINNKYNAKLLCSVTVLGPNDTEYIHPKPLLPNTITNSDDLIFSAVPMNRMNHAIYSETIQIITLLIMRIMVDFIFKNPWIFWNDYAKGLGITEMEFATILVASELGCIFALFIGEANEKYFKSYQNIMISYLFICGCASILTVVPFTNNTILITWVCICRFIVGMCFSCVSASSIKFATQINRSMKISTMIAILHYSWPLSTILNIFAGYMITNSWMWVFIISGFILIIMALVLKLYFSYTNMNDTLNVNEEIIIESDKEIFRHFRGLRVLISHKNSLLLISTSFFMNFRSATIYAVTSSFWLESTYNLNPFGVGISTLSVIIGEIAALIIMSFLAKKYKLWKCAVSALLWQFFMGGFILCILSLVYNGNYIGNEYNSSLITALIITFSLTMGHQWYYVIHQTNAIKYAPSKDLSFVLLLAERMSQEIGGIISLFLAVYLWNYFYKNAILIFSILWMVTTLCMTPVLLIYKSQPIQ